MKTKNTIIALSGLIIAGIAPLFGQGSPQDTTILNHTINGSGIMIASPESVSLGDAQSITGNAGGLAEIAEISTTFTVAVLDRRGTYAPLAVDVDITALKKTDATGTGTHVRPTNVIAQNAAGTTPGGVAYAPNSRVITETVSSTADFVTAPDHINRSFTFDVLVTAEAMTGADAQAGDYTGQIVFTVS